METLSARLAPLLLTPEQAVSLDVHGRTDAAVLVPLFTRGDELHAVFTRRRADLRRHAGEISFPTVVTSYAIYPFVGVIEPTQTWRPSASEVAEVLELSLPELRKGYKRERLVRRGMPFKTDVYATDGAFIWGATARILGDLFERLEPLL